MYKIYKEDDHALPIPPTYVLNNHYVNNVITYKDFTLPTHPKPSAYPSHPSDSEGLKDDLMVNTAYKRVSGIHHGHVSDKGDKRGSKARVKR